MELDKWALFPSPDSYITWDFHVSGTEEAQVIGTRTGRICQLCHPSLSSHSHPKLWSSWSETWQSLLRWYSMTQPVPSQPRPVWSRRSWLWVLPILQGLAPGSWWGLPTFLSLGDYFPSYRGEIRGLFFLLFWKNYVHQASIVIINSQLLYSFSKVSLAKSHCKKLRKYGSRKTGE